MTTTTTLRPMTESEYQRMRGSIFEDYARHTAGTRSISIEEGRQEAARQFEALLPDGIASQQPPLESGSLQLARKGRRVWPIDCGPATNIDCRVHIRVGGEPTRLTQER